MTRGRDRQFRDGLLDLARVRRGESILDVGCGTGTLAVAAKQRTGPTGAVHGIDASPEMIARATRKAARASVDVVFTTAVAERLPFPERSFDVVLNTVMLHHLPRQTRQQCALEIRRVLEPAGRLLVVDFSASSHSQKSLLRHFHRHGHTKIEDVCALLAGAGLNVMETGEVAGFRNLYFVLATCLPDRKTDARS